MINEVKKWRSFVNEREREVQDKYKAEFILSLRQEKDVDRTEVMNSMRAISDVTTAYRLKEISTSEQSFVAEYLVRFVLPHGTDAKHYYDIVLKPSLRKIHGVSVQRDKGYEKVE